MIATIPSVEISTQSNMPLLLECFYRKLEYLFSAFDGSVFCYYMFYKSVGLEQLHEINKLLETHPNNEELLGLKDRYLYVLRQIENSVTGF